MAAAKPEVLVSQLLHEILTKFQRLPPHIRGSAFQWSCCEYCCMKPEARNLRWRPLNRKYLYLSSYMRYKRNYNGYPRIFGGQLCMVRSVSTGSTSSLWI